MGGKATQFIPSFIEPISFFSQPRKVGYAQVLTLLGVHWFGEFTQPQWGKLPQRLCFWLIILQMARKQYFLQSFLFHAMVRGGFLQELQHLLRQHFQQLITFIHFSPRLNLLLELFTRQPLMVRQFAQ